MKKYKHVISCVVGLWKTLPRVIWYVAGLWRNFNMLFGVFCGEHQHAVYCVAGPWEKTKKIKKNASCYLICGSSVDKHYLALFERGMSVDSH